MAVTEKIQASYPFFFGKRFVTGVVDMSTIQKEAMLAALSLSRMCRIIQNGEYGSRMSWIKIDVMKHET